MLVPLQAWRFDSAYKLMFLSESGVDLEMGVPQRRLEFVGGRVFEVADEGLAGGTVPIGA